MNNLKKLFLYAVLAMLAIPVVASAQVATGWVINNDCGTIFQPRLENIICLQMENHAPSGRLRGVAYTWNGSTWIVWNSAGGSGSQHNVNGTNVLTNDPINFLDTTSIQFGNPSAGSITATPVLQSGSGVQISSGFSLLRSCSDGQLLKWTSGSSSWGCAADATGGTPTWNSITDPSGNLALAMAARTTAFTWGNATSSSNLFSLVDTASNSGTGYLMSLGTATGSAVKPLRFTAQGTANGVEMTTAGALQPIGTGSIITAFSSLTGTATTGQLPSTISAKTFDNTNTATFWDSLFTLQDNSDNTKQGRFNLSGVATAMTRTYDLPDANTPLLGDSDFTGSHTGRMRRTASSTYAVCRDNDAATADPTVNDDNTQNYCIGSEITRTNVSPRTKWSATDVSTGAAVWLPLGTTTETDTLATVLGRGRTDTTAVSFATSVRIGGSSSGWALYDDLTLGPIFVCVVGGVENACDWKRKLAAGKIWELQNSSGTPKFTFTESTGAITNVTLNAESTGNTLTTVQYASLNAASCNNATAAAGMNLPTANAPTPTCFGTTTTQGTLTFADGATQTGTRNFRLRGDWTGAVDVDLVWFANVSSANAVRWGVATGCTADGEATNTGPAAYNAQTPLDTAYTGTANQRKTTSFTGVATTNCAAGEDMTLQVQRLGGHANDTLTASAELLIVGLKTRAAQ